MIINNGNTTDYVWQFEISVVCYWLNNYKWINRKQDYNVKQVSGHQRYRMITSVKTTFRALNNLSMCKANFGVLWTSIKD